MMRVPPQTSLQQLSNAGEMVRPTAASRGAPLVGCQVTKSGRRVVAMSSDTRNMLRSSAYLPEIVLCCLRIWFRWC